MELKINLSKLDYTPAQIEKIATHSIMRGFSVLDSGQYNLLQITAPNDKLTTLSKAIRMIRAIKKQNI